MEPAARSVAALFSTVTELKDLDFRMPFFAVMELTYLDFFLDSGVVAFEHWGFWRLLMDWDVWLIDSRDSGFAATMHWVISEGTGS